MRFFGVVITTLATVVVPMWAMNKLNDREEVSAGLWFLTRIVLGRILLTVEHLVLEDIGETGDVRDPTLCF